MRPHCAPALFLLVALAIVLGGCAALVPRANCEQFDAQRKSTHYGTEYSRDPKFDARPLHRGTAIATEYRLWLEHERIAPCSHVVIRKELILLRQEAATVLEETREFFAQDGTRIAVKQENLTSQLRDSGRYRAAVPLPIPKNAPAGAYYLVSTLTAKTKGGGTQVLAKTAASFEVVVSK